MTKILSYLMILTAAPIAVFGAPQKVKEALANYVSQNCGTGTATIFLADDNDDPEFYRAYWAESRALLYFPKEFHDQAIDSPSLIVQSLKHPDDAREEGNKELESSTYLVSFDWYRKQLIHVITKGEILYLNDAQPVGMRNNRYSRRVIDLHRNPDHP